MAVFRYKPWEVCSRWLKLFCSHRPVLQLYQQKKPWPFFFPSVIVKSSSRLMSIWCIGPELATEFGGSTVGVETVDQTKKTTGGKER